MANNGTTNGSYGEPSLPAQQPNGAPANSSQPEQPSKEEVAWYFVESYYTTMSRTPEKLYVCYQNYLSNDIAANCHANMGLALLQQAIEYGTRSRGTKGKSFCWPKGEQLFRAGMQ